jgi:hypothetical protein
MASAEHLRFAQGIPYVDLRKSVAVLALLAAIPASRLAAAALAELLRRFCERLAEALVRWVAGGVELASGFRVVGGKVLRIVGVTSNPLI